eukprot:Partr_v1_DN28386_c3_g2_i2_m79772 putative thyroid hormone receptor interactor 13
MSLKGSEPSDSIRVVNSLLTQIDKLQKKENVLLLTTSNLANSIDLAFVDRADIRQYIGPPSFKAIYKIFDSCLKELQRVRLLEASADMMDARAVSLFEISDEDVIDKLETLDPMSAIDCSRILWIISIRSFGISGRYLRKISFLAYARFETIPVSMKSYFKMLMNVIVELQTQTLEFE